MQLKAPHFESVHRVRSVYRKYEGLVPVLSFMAGFSFDAMVLKRIDEPKVIVQQALYLAVAGWLTALELIGEGAEHPVAPAGENGMRRRLRKIWSYRESVQHFLLGTLLNGYTIFYFKSAGGLTSFFFVAGLAVLLIFNELVPLGRELGPAGHTLPPAPGPDHPARAVPAAVAPPPDGMGQEPGYEILADLLWKKFVRLLGKIQITAHVSLWSLCLISFCVMILPVAFGTVGTLMFLASLVTAAAVYAGCCRALWPWLPGDRRKFLRSKLAAPFGVVIVLNALAYFVGFIPPVPMSVDYLGIYHDVKHAPGGYDLTYLSGPHWFWQRGDQTFLARPGDSIFAFVQVYSPKGFHEELKVRWSYHDPQHGWTDWDAIPLQTHGGREEGFRGFVRKTNFTPGDWRVQVETQSAREIGWIGFKVEQDPSTGEREAVHVIR